GSARILLRRGLPPAVPREKPRGLLRQWRNGRQLSGGARRGHGMTHGSRHAQALLAWALLVSLFGGCASLGLESPDSLMKEGQQLYADKKYDEAIAKFERVIQLDRTQWLAYLYLARCYIAKGTWTKALTNARLAYEAAPGGEDVLP